MTHWGHTFLELGLGDSTEYVLDLTHGTPPKPKQAKSYLAIQASIKKMTLALDTAKRRKDAKDVDLLTKEIARLKHLYTHMRHN